MGGKIFRDFMLNQKIFEGYFLDGQNLAVQDLLVELTGEAGLSKKEATEVLENCVYKEAVDTDWMRSRQIRILGVPTFVIGQYRISGARPYVMLECFVVENTL